jgi:2-polyprenyl-3-methyl-5-hydroxy-6-metoxy-1,4-benzoquinol methylase
MDPFMESINAYPNLKRVTEAQLAVWPEHAKFLGSRFANDTPEFMGRTENIAKLVLLLTGDRLPAFCADYRWMCENFVEEELFFRRNKRYRRDTFEQANREVYGNAAYMSRYVNGILLSQLFWHNHAVAMDLFRTRFLPQLPSNFQHLEVGPGHGLFLAQAATDPKCGSVTGWDVSPASIAATTAALQTFGITTSVDLVEQDVLKAAGGRDQFDSAIISEVLEHLEHPQIALRTLHDTLRSGGLLCVNMPTNSPAPDHIYLCRTPDEVGDLVKGAGFEIREFHELPMTGYSLERARRMTSSISCVIFAAKP